MTAPAFARSAVPPVSGAPTPPPAAPVAPQQMETKVVEYTNSKAFQKGARKMSKDGWTVQSQTQVEQRRGCLRFLTIGLFAFFTKPKPRILVTWQRPLQ